MKLKIFILIVTSFLCSLYAAPVNKDEAERVAKNWQKSFSSSEHLSIKSSKMLEDALYVINFEGGGFVLVAADDASKPVLGYSPSQSFDHNIDKNNVRYWTNMYVDAIKEIREKKLSNQKTRNQWDEILSDNLTKTPREVTRLLSSTWNQSPIYNMYCPMDGNSLSVVGCVATAMAQIMNYHQYPLTGKDSHSYNILGQTLSVDYYLSNYNWDIMPDALSGSSTQEEAHEVAQISYHAGVAVEMMYSSTGSGAFSEDVPAALMNFFKYDSSISYEGRNGYNSTSWINMLKEQLDGSLPLYYSGSGEEGGHAFVCDGYDNSDYFHFNWGWGGSYDGYFQVDNLNPGGSTFNYGQAVVKNIIPKDYNLVLQNPIGDFQSNEDTFQIDLSEYFVSLSGVDIDYSVDPSSEIDGLQYEINGSILTLNKLYDGISKIIILANTRYDNSFDDFYFQFGSSPLLAGFGNAFNFNASAYLDAGTSEISDTMEEISVSAWIKLNEAGNDAGIISKASSSNTGWYLFLQNNNIVKFSVKTQDGLTRRIYSETALEADKWYHICTVYDGKDLMIYLNGSLDNIKTSYPERSALLNETGEHITIGDTYGIKFAGIIDEATIWQGAISLPKIRESMSKRPDIADESIISHWSFNEGFYDKAQDSKELHNGTFINYMPEYWTQTSAPLYFFTGTNMPVTAFLSGDDDENAEYSVSLHPSQGTTVINDYMTGEFTYSPDTDIQGLDEFKYQITYGDYITPSKTVYISVDETNSLNEENRPDNISFDLQQNYPNPFNPETMINFVLHRDMNAKLVVYNSAGKSVRTLAEGFLSSGTYKLKWDGKDEGGRSMSSGVYHFMLKANGSSKMIKSLLIK